MSAIFFKLWRVRADRLVSLVLLLQTRGQLSARALAAQLEVSVRTVYRDLAALSAAGVPVVAESGPGGGCRLLEGYRFPLRGLSPDEAEALLVLGVPAALAELGLADALSAAHRKISVTAGLRPAGGDRAGGSGGAAPAGPALVHLDMPRWFHGKEEVPHLRTLAQALRRHRRVLLGYQRGRGAGTTRVVDPFGLVNKAGIWYLVASSAASDTPGRAGILLGTGGGGAFGGVVGAAAAGIRGGTGDARAEDVSAEDVSAEDVSAEDVSAGAPAGADPAGASAGADPAGAFDGAAVFRAARITAARVLPEPCRRPAEFDLAAFWADWSASFLTSRPKVEVVLRASPQALAAFGEVFGDAVQAALDGAPPADVQGWRQVTLSFEHEAAAAHRLAGFGGLVEVLAPATVRSRLVETARRILERYQVD